MPNMRLPRGVVMETKDKELEVSPAKSENDEVGCPKCGCPLASDLAVVKCKQCAYTWRTCSGWFVKVDM